MENEIKVKFLKQTESFIKKYKLNNLYLSEIVKSNQFASYNAMDWLEGNWVFASPVNFDDIKKDDGYWYKTLAIQGSGENSKKFIQENWPFKVNINGKDYNILPVSLNEMDHDMVVEIKRFVLNFFSKIPDSEKYITYRYVRVFWYLVPENVKYVREIKFDNFNENEYNQIIL